MFQHMSVSKAPNHFTADIGITTDTASDLSSTCVVLELVAGRLDCQPRPNSQQQTLQLYKHVLQQFLTSAVST